MREKILVIVGPTASGKSALGVELARRFSGEIISADSRQVYKGLDIGTGKITKREIKGVPHHLLDLVSPKRVFSAGEFVRAAQKAHSNILKNVGMTIVVGGTGFYIDAFLGRITLPEVAPNNKLRARLAKKSTAKLFAMLKKIDPVRAIKMDTPSERNNKVRLIRAIEVSKYQKVPSDLIYQITPDIYDVLWIGVRPSDSELRDRIYKRLEQRIRKGMVQEAKRLHKAGLSYKRMRELGLEYRSLARHLQGKLTLEEMEKELQSDIWRYARKQIGYWKRNKEIYWFPPKSKKIAPLVRRWLKA